MHISASLDLILVMKGATFRTVFDPQWQLAHLIMLLTTTLLIPFSHHFDVVGRIAIIIDRGSPLALRDVLLLDLESRGFLILLNISVCIFMIVNWRTFSLRCFTS